MGRVLEQYSSGMVLPVKHVYVVLSYEGDKADIVGVYTEQCDAYKLARQYNKKYGAHCIFTKDGDFVEYDMAGTPEYCEVEEHCLNRKIKIK
jgi:hypothetical protein